MEWIFAIVVILIVVAVFMSLQQKEKRESAIETAKDELKRKGFVISKEVANSENTHTIFIDGDSDKWAILCFSNSKLDIYDYKNLIEFELMEDGESIIKGRTGSAIVGGALFGAVGAVAGASRKKKVRPVCNSMWIQIIVDDLKNPQHKIPIIKTQTKTDSLLYKLAKVNAESYISLFTLIKSRAEQD